MAHVGGRQAQLAQHQQLPGAITGFFLELTVGSLHGAFPGINPALDQPQLITVHAGGVFAHQQHGLLIKHGHHDHRAMATPVQPLELAALAIGKLQVQMFQLEGASLLLATAMDDRQTAAHACLQDAKTAGADTIRTCTRIFI